MNHLQALRVSAGLTQRELAVGAGCTQPTISLIERGSVPGIDLARAIVSALNRTGKVSVALDDIFPPAADQAA